MTRRIPSCKEAASQAGQKHGKELAAIMMKNYRETDPEFAERAEHFAFDEVVNEPGQQLDPVTRHMAILATLLGCQGAEVFRRELPQALDAGVTPVMVKEIVYQAAAYLGMGRVYPFLKAANEVLSARGISLPLEGQADGGEPRPLPPHARGRVSERRHDAAREDRPRERQLQHA